MSPELAAAAARTGVGGVICLAGEPLGVVAELLLNRERRVQRALWMVLVRDRRPE